jgi:beta-lactamase regulating signal transducer with metallopeptidase domain
MIDLGDTLMGLGRYVVAWSLQLGALIGFLWILLRFDRRHRPELRYRLLILTLVLSLVLPWISHRIGAFWLTAQIKQVWLEPVAPRSIATPRTVVSEETDRGASLLSTASAPAATPSISSIVYMTIGSLWCAGISIAATRRLQQHRRLSKIVKEAGVLPRTEGAGGLPILLSGQTSVPMLWSGGWLRPVILLPRNIMDWTTTEERAAIIRHEIVHFDRKDHWVSKLEELTRTILFFHPMARWLCRKMDIERELMCDAEVLRLGSDPDSYARTLLAVAQHAVTSESGVYFAAAAQLSQRVELLYRPYKTARTAAMIVPLTLLTPLAALGFWQARVASIPEIESGWTARFVPRPPLEIPQQATFIPPPTFEPFVFQVAQNPNPTPAPSQPIGMRSSVMVLRGQGASNEVRVTLGIPYTDIPFSPRTTAAGTNSREANFNVAMDVRFSSGRPVARRDDPIAIFVLASNFSEKGTAVYQGGFLLDPGAYNLTVAVTDTATGKTMGTLDHRFEISDLPRNALSAGSLVIADLIEPQAPAALSRVFSVGDLRVRPSVRNSFGRDEELKIFQQVYPSPNSSTILEVVITGGGQEVRRTSEELAKAPEINVVKRIPLTDFAPGQYEIQTLYSDPATGRRVGARAQFGVE